MSSSSVGKTERRPASNHRLNGQREKAISRARPKFGSVPGSSSPERLSMIRGKVGRFLCAVNVFFGGEQAIGTVIERNRVPRVGPHTFGKTATKGSIEEGEGRGEVRSGRERAPIPRFSPRIVGVMETRCWARAIRKGFDGSRSRRVLWLYGLAAFTSITMFVAFWFTNAFQNAILSNLELRNGTSAYLLWQQPPVGLLLSVYVFNYTNLDEFESGNATKLRVQEVGPFVYRENLSRVNAELHENGTVTYQEKRTFEWVSGEPDDQTVIVPNVLLVSILAFSRNLPYVMQLLLTMLLSGLRSKLFLELPVGEFLWGYEDELFRVIKPYSSLKVNIPFEKFGLLAFRSGVNEDRITMRTGVEDLEHIGLIERVNGAQDRKVWGDEKCDRVFGTDGSMFPPHWIEMPYNATLQVYAKDVCRRIPFEFERRDYAHGIPTYRFQLASNVFTTTPDENSCYCQKDPNDLDSRRCPPAGTFNVSSCRFGTPLLISFPHFYAADESLFEEIEGLSPKREHRESYIDLHQRLGVTVGTRMKIQLNMEVRKAVGVPFADRLKDGTILPVIWTDTEIEEMPESVKQLLYRSHYLVNAIEAGFQWCSLVGVVLFFGGLVAAFKKDEEPLQDIKLESSRDQRKIRQDVVAAT
ncbi:scavenger receptor class B member 1 [Megalopta genalis]|uniref:scavenger receptor class B member 1 n=1 Tax=Megalopta genalis TaxID=115081 RepID=UPI003FD0C29B